MKIRFFALVLALCLCLTLPVQAVGNGAALPRSKTYTGQFSDLPANSVFYDNVSALYEYGLSVGKPDGSFGLRDPLTVGQVIIFAGRLRSLWESGSPESGPAAYRAPGQSAAQPYLRYLQTLGALDTALDKRLSASATRAEVAHVLAYALPETAMPPLYQEQVTEGYATHRILTDVTAYTPYYRDILRLYSCGISMGCDEKGSYCPNALITRGAAAAMITRMADPALRVRPNWHSAPSVTMADLVAPGIPVRSPTTREQMDHAVRAMLFAGKNTLEFKYDRLSATDARKCMNAALSIVKSYCEQSYNSVSCSYSLDGALSLTFGSTAVAAKDLPRYQEETMKAALAVQAQLRASGAIRDNMNETDKALAYYKWICANCVYDPNAKDNSLSHLPWNLFTQGKAVCDGYTGAYNLLLKLEGIECYALSNASHIWTVAKLDGREVHIDPTWGDQQGGADLQFFAMTPQQSRQQHPW